MTKPVIGEEQEIEGELPAFHGVNKAIHDRLLETYKDGNLHPDQGNGLTPEEEAAIERIMKEQRWLDVIREDPDEENLNEDGPGDTDPRLHEVKSDSQSHAQQ